jgi:uncharacterized protein (DUF3820 family)
MEDLSALADGEELIRIVNQVMPFGRFKGGFPEGTLGRRMAVMYEIKANGLEGMLQPLLENS